MKKKQPKKSQAKESNLRSKEPAATKAKKPSVKPVEKKSSKMKPEKKYEDHYQFCFPNKSIWEDLVGAMESNNPTGVRRAVAAQLKETQAAAKAKGKEVRDALLVDGDISAYQTRDADLLAIKPDNKAEDLDGKPIKSYEQELQLVKTLSELRDLPLADLDKSLPTSVRQVSYFLRDRKVRRYAAGQSFGASKAEHDHLYKGFKPEKELVTGGQTEILTGRDFCSLVHTDNPMDFVAEVIGTLAGTDHLLPNNPKGKVEPLQRKTHANTRNQKKLDQFAGGGPPFLLGACGEVLRRVGLISFREKMRTMQKRPAQEFAERGDYLSSAYPELHPEHPSRNAMHFIAYAAIVGFLKEVYPIERKLVSGNTIEFELNLARDNFGDGRCWPGVHTRLDHTPFLERAETLGKRVASEIYGSD